MRFTEPLFIAGLAVSAGIFRLCPPNLRMPFLLALSYLFYFTWSVRGAAALAIVTVAAYLAGLSVEKTRGVPSRIGPVMALLFAAYLMAFKIALLTPSHGIWGLVMPLGVSYYSFKLISYVLDVYRGTMPAERRFVAFAAYVAFFPQLPAGPIQRPESFFAQLPARPVHLFGPWARIALGITKKLLIADNLAPAVNLIYSKVTALHGAPLWLGFYLFPLQLYADFSGLTDIAIGVGQLFGITGPENFNRPFTASSIGDYWRRWHMSLTNWLGDYVFLPLRMATRQLGAVGLAFSVTVNMIAIALWHGLTLAYLAFGVLNSAYLVADVLTARRRAKFFKQNPRWDAAGTWLGWLLTFHLIFIAEVFFRAPRVSDATSLLSGLWTQLAGSGAILRSVISECGARQLFIGLVGYGILELGERFRPDLAVKKLYFAGRRWVRWSLSAVCAVVALTGLALLTVHASGAKSAFLYEIF